MLYGMDDTKDLIIVEKQKLNIKKVIVFITVVFLCFLTIFLSFLVSYKSMIKKNNVEFSNYNEETEIEDKEEHIEKISGSKAINSTSYEIYEGSHTKIATHDIEKIKSKLIPVYNQNAREEIRNIYYSDEKQVYLTFDDGPSRDITPMVLDILKEEGVPATFFILGSRAELYPDTVKRAYEEGHYIANHGYSHKYSLIYQGTETVFGEYAQCEQVIRNVLSNQDYNSHLFRFPGGSTGGVYAKIKTEAREYFDENNIAYTNWNCLSGDAEGMETKEEQIQKFFETKADRNGLIVLMHDANDKVLTPEVLREIIPILKNEGYVFKNFYEIFR